MWYPSRNVVSLQQPVDSLESQFDDLEQYSRRNCVKITSVVEKKIDENTQYYKQAYPRTQKSVKI